MIALEQEQSSETRKEMESWMKSRELQAPQKPALLSLPMVLRLFVSLAIRPGIYRRAHLA
jgi:hypothetical protein